jgi:outer membrane murein-binding lipoprotein Lpp
VNLIDPWGLLSTGQNFTISAVSTVVTLVASAVATPAVGAALGGAVAFGATLAAGGSMNEAITNGLMSSVGALAFPFAELGEAAMAVRPGAYALGLMGEFGMDLLTTKIPPIPLFTDYPCE